MEKKRNYQRELDRLLERPEMKQDALHLLLHACCAPCSSYVLEYLSEYFRITVLYYNPNIFPEEEYRQRAGELRRLISEMSFSHPVRLMEAPYQPEVFFNAVRGLESVPEGGERCFVCYRLRLRESARLASLLHCDYFTTTLSISPLKNAAKINEIGEELGEVYRIPHLPSDFKKKNGYKRSIELSREHELYRQNYCGCIYSRRKNCPENE